MFMVENLVFFFFNCFAMNKSVVTASLI